MRLNQEIAKDPDTYLDAAPALVPILGEYPHGLHHILHTVHRGFKPLIMRCAAECGNPAIVEDPAEVKHFNSHLYFHWKIVRAASEYVHELSQTVGGLDFEDVPALLKAAERNIDLAWVVHYLYDGGYLLLDFKQSLRGNASDQLDLNWREFVTLARAANKTNYGILAIIQAYRSAALHPQLAQFWRAVRTLPMSTTPGARVGWDTPCEWLHADFTASVRTRVTEGQIEKFIANKAFLTTVERHVRSALQLDAALSESKLKDMADDVKAMKELFRSCIGATWATAASEKSVSELFKKDQPKGKTPWAQYKDVSCRSGDDATSAYVQRHLMRYAFRHEWQP